MSKLSLIDRYEFFEELAVVLQHVPQDIPQHLKTKLGVKVKLFLLRGFSLGKSFALVGGDIVIVSLLEASQGLLKEVVPDIVLYYRLLLNIRTGVKKQLLYPLLTLVTAVLVLTGFFVFIYPVLTSIGSTKFVLSPILLCIIIVSLSICVLYYRQIREYLVQSTGIPKLFEQLHIVLLIQLAPDTLSLVRILRQYDAVGLAALCFQLERAVPLSTALRCINFSERDLLLIEQASEYGNKQVYNSIIENLRLAIENKFQTLTQMIEPLITIITGGLVGCCVYIMLMPVIQLQSGLAL